MARAAPKPVLPRASVRATLALLGQVVGPLLAKGIILRRPSMVRLLQASGAERSSVRVLQALRARHGGGPVMLRTPFRTLAVILDVADVRRVLEGRPEPFETDMAEKRAALAHFEPRTSLASRGRPRGGAGRVQRRSVRQRPPGPRHGRRAASRRGADRRPAARRGGPRRRADWNIFRLGWRRIA